MVYSLGERKVEVLAEDYFIADNATVVGSVCIHNNVSIWFNAVIRADNELVTIGENSNIQDGAVLHNDDDAPLTIGKNVTVGHKAMLHGCTIGDNTLVGINSVVLDKAVIGKNCVIGANALVTGGVNIPDGSLVLGSPAKVVAQLSEEHIATITESANTYVKNFKRFKAELKEQQL